MKRKGYSTQEGQAEANKRYREKNKEHRNYLSARSASRSFINNKATIDDLTELESLIKKRKDESQ